MRARLICAAVSLALALAGVLLLIRAGDGLTVHDTVADGVPITEVRPAGGTLNGGGVVVAHGFAGSARLMRPFADTLARRGFVVVLFDFARHGRNTSTDASNEVALDAAVRHLRSLPSVDATRISLVGHSMGAGAVTRYAASHPEIAATAAISLGSVDNVPPRMLLIVGGLEFSGFQRAAAQAAESGRHRVVTVPGVEHISVLFAPRTHEEILRWLGAPPGPAPSPWLRLLAGALLLVAFAVGLYPLTTLLPRSAPLPDPPSPYLLVVAPFGALLAIGVSVVLPDLSVGVYVGFFTALTGSAMLTAWGLIGGRPPAFGKLSLPPLIFLGYAVISVAVPIHFGLTHAMPTGQRWLLLPAMLLAFAVLGLGAVVLTGGRLRRMLTVFACTAVALTGAAVVGAAPGFLLLIVPLIVLLLGWQAVWTAVLIRSGAPAWLAALACAVLPAWPTATAMPL